MRTESLLAAKEEPRTDSLRSFCSFFFLSFLQLSQPFFPDCVLLFRVGHEDLSVCLSPQVVCSSDAIEEKDARRRPFQVEAMRRRALLGQRVIRDF